jgi:GNAT superfamily N-acetyltransferase
MDIIAHDPAETADWSSFHAFRRARHAESSPDEPILTDAQFEAQQREVHPHYVRSAWLAVDNGLVVGSLSSFRTQEGSPFHAENARHLSVGCSVLGPWRRRRIATRLLARLHRLMCEDGRTIATASTYEGDGQAFLQRIGAGEKLRVIDNRLRFDGLDWAKLRGWKDDIVAANPDLTIETYVRRVPLDLCESMMPELERLLADVPLGDLDVPPTRLDMSQVREHYRQLDLFGGAHDLVVFRDADGRIAGVAEIHWDARFPGYAYHSFTGVRRDMRGRGLATALKVAALELVRANHPSVMEMRTTNAAHNVPMLAVNAKLGFRAHRAVGAYQIDRDRLGVLVRAA